MFAFVTATLFPGSGTLAPLFAQTTAKNQVPILKASTESLIEGTRVVLKIVAVKDNAMTENDYSKPDSGNKFMSVQVIVDNTNGKDGWEIKPENLVLKDTEGNVYQPEGNTFGLVEVTKPTLKSGILDSGDLVKGWVTFQIGSTVDVKSARLRYEQTLFESVKSGWLALSAVGK